MPTLAGKMMRAKPKSKEQGRRGFVKKERRLRDDEEDESDDDIEVAVSFLLPAPTVGARLRVLFIQRNSSAPALCVYLCVVCVNQSSLCETLIRAIARRTHRVVVTAATAAAMLSVRTSKGIAAGRARAATAMIGFALLHFLKLSAH